MKKEDYMKLSKEMLAELVAERDLKNVAPTIIGTPRPCYEMIVKLHEQKLL